MNLPHYLYRSPKRGTYSFRLGVPEKHREAVGKREIKVALKTADLSLARRRALKLYEDAQQMFRAYSSPESRDASSMQLFAKTVNWSRHQGLNPFSPPDPHLNPGEWAARDAVADRIIEKIEAGKATRQDQFQLAALEGKLKRPPPSVQDAVNLYLKERNGPDARREDKRVQFEQRVRRAERYLLESLATDKTLMEVSRSDARNFRDYLKGRVDLRDGTSALKPASVNRMLNDVSAIFNHANTELELGRDNPFKNLKVEEHESKQEKRRSFTTTEMKAYLDAVQNLNSEARHCTVLMAYTGARTGEITGLEVQDVQLDCAIPHIIIRPNATRPKLKTGASKRLLPLVGDALEAAKLALAEVKNGQAALFPRYAVGRGEDRLSALQNKVLRQRLKIVDKKLTAYSTRHTLKDKLRNALVPSDLQDAIMGHSRGQVSAGYGDGYWLPRLKEALEAALDIRRFEPPIRG